MYTATICKNATYSMLGSLNAPLMWATVSECNAHMPPMQQVVSIKQMSSDVSKQLTSWWSAAAQLPDIPALAAAMAAAGQQQQQQYSRQAVLLMTLVAGFFPLTHR